MTRSTDGTLGTAPVSGQSNPLMALVRLLARTAARADFGSSCNTGTWEVDHD
ncbi:hypothetical protein [Ruegeria marina]|uniref:hypothetical protein n=1 Tax=Ruegeria marina TaxID=639004 RepID=UPI0015A4D579|nr:hypothetical protein [Ruegeria marina]